MKRILSILLAASMLASVTALAAGGSILEQVVSAVAAWQEQQNEKTGWQSAEWAKSELAQAERADLIPEALADRDLTRPITRQEYAAAAVALYDQLLALNPGAVVMEREASYPEGRQGPFTDTDDPAVNRAYAVGLVEGVGGGKFAPDGNLTREQAATMLRRAISLTGLTLPGLCGTNYANMTDTDTVSDWAREGASMMANMGIIQGKPDGTAGTKFDPRGTLTGQEALVMNGRLVEQMAAFAQDAAEQTPSFNADFFAAVTSQEPNKSLSPVSLRYALGLLRAGARGTTAEQLDRLLTGADFDLWNEALTTGN